MPRNQPITPDLLRQSIPDVVAFLKALEQTVPGHVPEELVAELESVAKNNLAVELLARAMGWKS